MLSELHNMKDAEIRSACRDKIESLEHWLRRLIDDTLTPVYGDYFDFTDDKGNRLISSKLSQQVEDRRMKEASRYPRKIDAVLLDDAIAIICKPELYKQHFRNALANAFPDGEAEARTFLSRLLVPRNSLAHANAISSRQAEQIICYSNDVIESLKKYYSELGMQQEYNVPLILKVTDSFGNVFTRSQFRRVPSGGMMLSFTDQSDFFLHPGDILTLEIEIDPSFETDSYDIKWGSTTGLPEPLSGSRAVIPITTKQVCEQFDVQCRITSKKDWHRMHTGFDKGSDDLLIVDYKVLPPVE
jgi:hypothetical protein